MSRTVKPQTATPPSPPTASAEVQYRHVYGNLHDLAEQMANDVCVALAIEVDELNTGANDFRRAIGATTWRVMQHIDKSEERVGIYEEALPGFTLMVVKKDDGKLQPSHRPDVQDDLVIASETFDAASMVIQQFMNKSKQSIISIEHDSVVIVLFPVADTRKHLKALGLYQT